MPPATTTAAAAPEPGPSGGSGPDPAPASASASAASRPRVLLLTHRLPYPPDRGDRIRSYNLLRVLARHFDLAVAATSDEPVWLQHHQLLASIARRVCIQPISDRVSKFRAACALLSGRPATPACFFRQALADAILQWHEQEPFDLVLTFCTGMIDYARLLTQPGHHHGPYPRHILDLVDVDSAKWAEYAGACSPPMSWVYRLEAGRLRRVERGDLDRFDAVTVISRAEADAYRRHVGEHPGLAVVNNGVDTHYFSPQPDSDSHDLVFVGVLNYLPNVQGVSWFARQVMPVLRRRVPDARLLVVGRHPSPAVLELGQLPDAGVEVVGSVPDVRTYLRDAAVAIAPLQIARGVQNKVLEAMSCRKPVVCSPAAFEGIDAQDGRHLLVADTPERWADAIQSLFRDAARRNAIADAAREHVVARYSWDTALNPMIELIHRVLTPTGLQSGQREA